MTTYDTLCLEDKALEHWSCMKKALLSRSCDVKDFQVFCSALLEHYVGTSISNTVQVHLIELRHTGSVVHFHSKLRDMKLESVSHLLFEVSTQCNNRAKESTSRLFTSRDYEGRAFFIVAQCSTAPSFEQSAA